MNAHAFYSSSFSVSQFIKIVFLAGRIVLVLMPWPELLEAWLVLTSVNYHRNI